MYIFLFNIDLTEEIQQPSRLSVSRHLYTKALVKITHFIRKNNHAIKQGNLPNKIDYIIYGNNNSKGVVSSCQSQIPIDFF